MSCEGENMLPFYCISFFHLLSFSREKTTKSQSGLLKSLEGEITEKSLYREPDMMMTKTEGRSFVVEAFDHELRYGIIIVVVFARKQLFSQNLCSVVSLQFSDTMNVASNMTTFLSSVLLL